MMTTMMIAMTMTRMNGDGDDDDDDDADDDEWVKCHISTVSCLFCPRRGFSPGLAPERQSESKDLLLLHSEHIYTEKFLRAEAFTQRGIYTEQLLHRRFCTQTLLHTDAFTHRSFYTEKPLHRKAFSKEALPHEAFTQSSFTHRPFFTKTLFTHRNFNAQMPKLLHTGAFAHTRLTKRSF